MRIRELTIQNYRAFGEKRTFPFSTNFTAIAGVNGRGKTSLLDGLALLASRILPHISPARSGYRTLGQLDLHNGHGPLSLSMNISCGDIPIKFGVTLMEGAKAPEVTKLAPAVKKAARNIYETTADDLSARRRKTAKLLDKSVLTELPALKLEKALFETAVESDASKPGAQGIDRVEFKVATNPGAALQPLMKKSRGFNRRSIDLPIIQFLYLEPQKRILEVEA